MHKQNENQTTQQQQVQQQQQQQQPLTNDIYYSPYGYLHVPKHCVDSSSSSSSIVPFTKPPSLTGSINVQHLSKKITIHLKAFYGSRPKHAITISIDEPLSNILPLFISLEANEPTNQFNSNRQYRIFAPQPKLRELCLYLTAYEENINNNDVLLLLDPESVKFSSIMKTNHLYLDKTKRSITKMDVDDCEFCLCEHGFKLGKRYIEFILESEPIENNIMIGVSLKRKNYKYEQAKDFYGYILSQCELVWNEANTVVVKEYGIQTKIGDKIGMLIELGKNEREISFYINEVAFGVAFKDLPMDVLYPCVCLGFQGTKLSLRSKVDFPEG